MFFYLWKNRSRPPFGSYEFFKTWAKRALTFPTLLSVSANRQRLTMRGASIAPDACIGKVKAEGRLSHLTVGQSTFIGRATLMLHDTLEIGACVCINDGVTMLTGSHDVRDPLWRHILKPIKVDDFAWIATGATILPGVKIGRGAVVGAACVVTKDVPPYAIASGNPAVVRENVRVRELSYNPVQFLSFQDAWLGKEVRERRSIAEQTQSQANDA